MQVFSSKYSEILQNSFIIKHLRWLVQDNVFTLLKIVKFHDLAQATCHVS